MNWKSSVKRCSLAHGLISVRVKKAMLPWGVLCSTNMSSEDFIAFIFFLSHCQCCLTKVKVNWACFLVPLCKPSAPINLMQVIIVFGSERLDFFLDEDWQFDGCSGNGADGFEVHGGWGVRLRSHDSDGRQTLAHGGESLLAEVPLF